MNSTLRSYRKSIWIIQNSLVLLFDIDQNFENKTDDYPIVFLSDYKSKTNLKAIMPIFVVDMNLFFSTV